VGPDFADMTQNTRFRNRLQVVGPRIFDIMMLLRHRHVLLKVTDTKDCAFPNRGFPNIEKGGQERRGARWGKQVRPPTLR
jgi:hypothetical protein